MRQLDDYYFTLVELVRSNFSVPPIALNAVIIAAGRINQVCGMGWSGVEWSEVEWHEVEWGEVEWSGVGWGEVEWSGME